MPRGFSRPESRGISYFRSSNSNVDRARGCHRVLCAMPPDTSCERCVPSSHIMDAMIKMVHCSKTLSCRNWMRLLTCWREGVFCPGLFSLHLGGVASWCQPAVISLQGTYAVEKHIRPAFARTPAKSMPSTLREVLAWL